MSKVQLSRMHRYYEKDPLHTCGKCCNITHFKYEGTAGQQYRYKCKRYDESSNAMSDWKIGWTACGAYNQPMTKAVRPLIELYADTKKDNSPIPGQIDLFVRG